MGEDRSPRLSNLCQGWVDQGRVHGRPCGRRRFRRDQEEGNIGKSGKEYIMSRTEKLLWETNI